MIAIIPLMLTLGFAAAGLSTLRQVDTQTARNASATWAGWAFALTTIITVATMTIAPAGQIDPSSTSGVGLSLLPPGIVGSIPLVTAAVAWLTFALSPVRTHSPAVLGAMWGLFAVAFGFVIIGHPMLLTVLWAASVVIVTRALDAVPGARGLKRLFAAYQLPSLLAFAIGAFFVWHGSTQTGAPMILLAIAIREATIPVHSWFPRFVEAAPLGLVVAFAGPQLGVYAQLELLSSMRLGPVAHGIATIGAITAIVGAAMAVSQTSARRALAYMIISQTGLVAFGLESDSPVGRTGALLTWQVLALSTSGFAMALAALEARRGSPQDLSQPHGNFARMPRLALAFLLFGFASVGFPVTLGFVAEDLLVQGTVDEFPVLGLVLIVATALNGITVMRAFFMLFTGTREHRGEHDLTHRERWVVTVIGAGVLLAGILPAPIVGMDRVSHEALDQGQGPAHVAPQGHGALAAPQPAAAGHRE